MSFWYIVILSLVQGLTEFLPVSSSGHLALVPKLLEAADQGIVMDVALHVGTLCAVLVYYRRDVWDMGWAVLRWKTTPNVQMRNLAVFIVLATIPAVAVGLAIHKFFPEGIRDVRVIITTTIFFGLLMGIADYFFPRVKKLGDLKLRNALVIGCAQALALIPGTSRSGVTMTAARFMGFDRVDAARFSFLLGIPAIAAAGFLGVLDLLKADDPGMWKDVVLAVFLAFLAGLGAIHFMMKWLQRFGLLPFAAYRLILGAFLLFFLFSGN